MVKLTATVSSLDFLCWSVERYSMQEIRMWSTWKRLLQLPVILTTVSAGFVNLIISLSNILWNIQILAMDYD